MACPKSWLAFARTVHSAEIFDVVVVSYELGHAKPDREIYEATLSKLGVVPQDALFVDDRGENIAAADELGLADLPFHGR